MNCHHLATIFTQLCFSIKILSSYKELLKKLIIQKIRWCFHPQFHWIFIFSPAFPFTYSQTCLVMQQEQLQKQQQNPSLPLPPTRCPLPPTFFTVNKTSPIGEMLMCRLVRHISVNRQLTKFRKCHQVNNIKRVNQPNVIHHYSWSIEAIWIKTLSQAFFIPFSLSLNYEYWE